MEEFFLNRELSIELKNLGLNEPCFAFYEGEVLNKSMVDKKIQEENNEDNYFVLAPTTSQALSFFRKKYGLYTHIAPEFYTTQINFNWQILWYIPKQLWTRFRVSGGTFMYGDNGEYPTYEEAEIACIKKMIEISKNK